MTLIYFLAACLLALLAVWVGNNPSAVTFALPLAVGIVALALDMRPKKVQR